MGQVFNRDKSKKRVIVQPLVFSGLVYDKFIDKFTLQDKKGLKASHLG